MLLVCSIVPAAAHAASGNLDLHDGMSIFTGADIAQLQRAARRSGLPIVLVTDPHASRSRSAWEQGIRDRWLRADNVVIAFSISNYFVVFPGDNTAITAAQVQQEVARFQVGATPGVGVGPIADLMQRLGADNAQSSSSLPNAAVSSGLSSVGNSIVSLAFAATFIGWITVYVRRRKPPMSKGARRVGAAICALSAVLLLARGVGQFVSGTDLVAHSCGHNLSASAEICQSGYVEGLALLPFLVGVAALFLVRHLLRPKKAMGRPGDEA